TSSFSGGDEYLLNGHRFSASGLVAAEAAFAKAGLQWSSDGARIRVPRATQHQYVAALVDGKALPNDINSPIEAAASESVGPFDSKDQRERVMKIAKQQMLSVVVRSMKGIENAIVTYDSHIKRGLKREE